MKTERIHIRHCGRRRLRLGAALHFLIAIGHIGCLFALDEAFEAYGIREIMYQMVFGHVWMLYALTIGLVLAFCLAGLYALSATGDIRHLPLTRTAIITIVVLYSFRALAGGISCIHDFTWLQFISSLVPAIIAWCYWPGVKMKKNKEITMNRFKFNTVGLFTRDNKAIVDFYTKTFGFTTDWDGIQPNVEMTLGDMRIILYPRDAFEQMVSQKFQYPEGFNGTMELAFNVPTFADVDKEYQDALANGAASVLPPTTEPWGQRTSYVADPDGNLIEIGSFTK